MVFVSVSTLCSLFKWLQDWNLGHEWRGCQLGHVADSQSMRARPGGWQPINAPLGHVADSPNKCAARPHSEDGQINAPRSADGQSMRRSATWLTANQCAACARCFTARCLASFRAYSKSQTADFAQRLLKHRGFLHSTNKIWNLLYNRVAHHSLPL